MADQAHEWTDEQIEALERKFAKVYAQAEKEMRQKLSKYLSDYDEKNSKWKADMASGKATRDQYDAWLKSQASRRGYLSSMVNTLATDAVNANKRASELINDAMPQVYAENANYAAYDIESGLGYNTHAFDLYDQDTIRRIMRMNESDQIIKEVISEGVPIPPMQSLRVNPDEAKDVRWNRQKFNSAITQSILQGESIPHTSKRLMEVLNMDRRMAVRAARTAMTSAENAGRVDSYERAKRAGIDIEQQWMATHDERTRFSHRELDGQHVAVGGFFKVPSNGHKLRFPADPTAHPSEVWNCRCTLVAWSEEMEAEDPEQWSKIPDSLSYDEWKAGMTTGQLDNEKKLLKRLDMLNARLEEFDGKPIKYVSESDYDDYTKYLSSQVQSYKERMEKYEWASGFDEDALRKESMKVYDEYEKALEKFYARQRNLDWDDPEYKRIDVEKDKWREKLDALDKKIDAVRAYKRSKQHYESFKQQYEARVANKYGTREEVSLNRQNLAWMLRARNGVIARISRKQEFAKQVRETVGDEYVDGMFAKLQEAKEKHPTIAGMFERYCSQFAVRVKDRDDGGAHYDPDDKGIYYNAQEDARGSSFERPYGVVYHEFGHLIDNMSMFDRQYSSLYDELETTIKKDWTRFQNSEAKKMGVTRNKKMAVINMLKREMRAIGPESHYAYSDISDVIEGCAKVDAPLGFGHSVSYHTEREGQTAKEFFAEVCAASMANESSYQQLIRVFPNAVKQVEDIAGRL